MRLNQSLHLPAQTTPGADEAVRRDWAETNLGGGGGPHTILSATHTDADETKAPVGGDLFKFVGGMWVPGRAAWGEVQGKPTTFPPDPHGHDLATTTASGFMAGADKGKLDTLAAPERVYQAPTWTAYFKTFPKSWDSAITNPPEITVPALGVAPTGFQWMLDVQGAIRLRPDANNNSFFISVGFDRVASTSVDGGGPLFGSLQGALPVTKYMMTPPALDRSFTINFTFWCAVAGSFEILPGPFPTVRCYLVKL